MRVWRCIKCEQKIKIVEQRPNDEAYEYGEFPRMVFFSCMAGTIDRGASGIKVKFSDPATEEAGANIYGRICERCIDELAQKEIVRAGKI